MKQISIVLLILVVVTNVHSQNNASPYSIIGIGDIEKGHFDRTTGMGYAGVALSSERSIFSINPASYSALQDKFFNAETSVRYKGVSYSGNAITSGTNSFSSDLVSKKIIFAIKVKPRWGLSFGLLPYSTSNYSFAAKKSLQGTSLTTDAAYQGSGSLNQAYIAGGYRLAKGLSLGIQAGYLFGQQQQEETVVSGLGSGSLYTKKNVYINNSIFTAGLQYNYPVSKKLNIAIGATASNKTTLDASYSLLVQDGTQTIENIDHYKSSDFTLPMTFTTGIAAIYKNKYTFAVDYNHQDWNATHYVGSSYTLVNSDRVSAGFEYSKKFTYLDHQYEKSFFQAGVFYSNSYLKMNGQQLKDYGATIGAGFHAMRSGLGVQGALEIGTRGTTANGLIRENYTQFTLTLLYRDFWFGKRKYD